MEEGEAVLKIGGWVVSTDYSTRTKVNEPEALGDDSREERRIRCLVGGSGDHGISGASSGKVGHDH